MITEYSAFVLLLHNLFAFAFSICRRRRSGPRRRRRRRRKKKKKEEEEEDGGGDGGRQQLLTRGCEGKKLPGRKKVPTAKLHTTKNDELFDIFYPHLPLTSIPTFIVFILGLLWHKRKIKTIQGRKFWRLGVGRRVRDKGG